MKEKFITKMAISSMILGIICVALPIIILILSKFSSRLTSGWSLFIGFICLPLPILSAYALVNGIKSIKLG